MGNQLAAVKKEVFDVVSASISGYVQSGEIALPEKYSFGNAIKSAWLVLQETKDSKGNPVLGTCTKPSIINALQQMVYQGLNPDKKQCYFIPFGDKLTFIRSYFGSISVAKRVDPTITDICYDVVYKSDVFNYEKRRGKTIIAEHKQQLDNIGNDNIVAAYCSIFRGDDETTFIMTMDEIKAAWKKSKMNPVTDNGTIKAGSTHAQYTKDMAIKTVVNHACKYVINTSNDGSLVLDAALCSYDETTSRETIIEDEITDNANKIDLDFDQTDSEAGGESFTTEEALDEEDLPNF